MVAFDFPRARFCFVGVTFALGGVGGVGGVSGSRLTRSAMSDWPDKGGGYTEAASESKEDVALDELDLLLDRNHPNNLCLFADDGAGEPEEVRWEDET